MLKLLIAVDGSPHAQRAIEAAARLEPLTVGLDVVLVHVRDVPIHAEQYPVVDAQAVEFVLQHQQSALLDEAQAQARRAGLKQVRTQAEVGLAAQLRDHTCQRTYICVAHGHMRSQRIESMLVPDRGDGLRGSSRHAGQGKRAVTHVETLSSWNNGSVCQVKLETGKTHQIRIHLAEAGHPLVGEQVYMRDFENRGGKLMKSPRLLLHAATLGFVHPITGEPVAFSARLPPDFRAAVAALHGELPPEL